MPFHVYKCSGLGYSFHTFLQHKIQLKGREFRLILVAPGLIRRFFSDSLIKIYISYDFQLFKRKLCLKYFFKVQQNSGVIIMKKIGLTVKPVSADTQEEYRFLSSLQP